MRWWVHAWPEACTRLAASGHRAGGFTSGSGWALVGRALYGFTWLLTTSRCVLDLPYLGSVSSKCCAEQGSI